MRPTMFTSEMWSMLATSMASATFTGGPARKEQGWRRVGLSPGPSIPEYLARPANAPMGRTGNSWGIGRGGCLGADLPRPEQTHLPSRLPGGWCSDALLGTQGLPQPRAQNGSHHDWTQGLPESGSHSHLQYRVESCERSPLSGRPGWGARISPGWSQHSRQCHSLPWNARSTAHRQGTRDRAYRGQLGQEWTGRRPSKDTGTPGSAGPRTP